MAYHVFQVHERVVDGLHGNGRVLVRGAEDQTADAAEAVDTETSGHGLVVRGRRFSARG